MDEVFGSENFAAQITFKTTTGAGSFSGGTNVLAAVSNFLVWYAKDLNQIKYRQLYRNKIGSNVAETQYTWVEMPDGTRRQTTAAEREEELAGARFFSQNPLTSQTTRTGQTTVFPVEFEGKSVLG
jgi:adenine-specific DNA-methyltransferase